MQEFPHLDDPYSTDKLLDSVVKRKESKGCNIFSQVFIKSNPASLGQKQLSSGLLTPLRIMKNFNP